MMSHIWLHTHQPARHQAGHEAKETKQRTEKSMSSGVMTGASVPRGSPRLLLKKQQSEYIVMVTHTLKQQFLSQATEKAQQRSKVCPAG